MVHKIFPSFYLSFLLFLVSSLVLANGDKRIIKAWELFQKRAENKEAIIAAKGIYFELIKDKGVSLNIRREALEKFARLSIYEGEVGREKSLSNKGAAHIFETCIKATDYLSPKKISQKVPEYTYWRAMCLGLWGANSSMGKVLFKVHRISELRNLIKEGQKRFKDYDNHGFNLIEAGFHCRSKFLTAFDLFHPEKSIELIDESLLYPIDNYMSYILKAEVLMMMHKIDEAKFTLRVGIEELSSRLKKNSIPSYVLEENKIFLKKMKDQLAKLK
jgi:hypothetical protein